jgi:hypothetical protein
MDFGRRQIRPGGTETVGSHGADGKQVAAIVLRLRFAPLFNGPLAGGGAAGEIKLYYDNEYP